MNYSRDNRLRAIAINAVREARIAYERDASQWIDDDAHRANLIMELLQLAEVQNVDTAVEALPLVSTNQAKPNPALDAIADALGLLDKAEEPTLKLPKAKLSTV